MRTRFARSFKFGTRRPLLAVEIHSRRPLESNDFNAIKTYDPDNRSTPLTGVLPVRHHSGTHKQRVGDNDSRPAG